MTPRAPSPSPVSTVPLAWNGIGLRLPQSWSPARLGLGYLLFEDDSGPVFEFKWRRGAGREGMEAALRALTPKGRATSGQTLPEEWLCPLAHFELMPLSWRREGHTGLGAALFCPECGMAAVFQAYGAAGGLDQASIAAVGAVLASLSHHEAEPPTFRIFGFAVTPPAGFVLTHFDFEPGRFSLTFMSGRQRLDVVRLAPAGVLLGASDLETQATRAFGLSGPVVARPGTVAGCPAVWLAQHQGNSLGAAVLRRLGRPGRLAVLRHDAACDKLLGAALTAPKPVDPDWLADVAGRCVSV